MKKAKSIKTTFLLKENKIDKSLFVRVSYDRANSTFSLGETYLMDVTLKDISTSHHQDTIIELIRFLESKNLKFKVSGFNKLYEAVTVQAFAVVSSYITERVFKYIGDFIPYNIIVAAKKKYFVSDEYIFSESQFYFKEILDYIFISHNGKHILDDLQHDLKIEYILNLLFIEFDCEHMNGLFKYVSSPEQQLKFKEFLSKNSDSLHKICSIKKKYVKDIEIEDLYNRWLVIINDYFFKSTPVSKYALY